MADPRRDTTGVVAGRLALAGCVAADEEAEELVSAAPDDDTLLAWVARRERGEPLAWIVGFVRFCGRFVAVDRGVYVPRRQTEELARRAAALLAATAGGAAGDGGTGRAEAVTRAADLCTGAGAVAAHLRAAVPGATVTAVDVDPAAAACASRNGVPVVVGDLASPLASGAFDLVTAVAPYVPTGDLAFLPADVMRYEPRVALDGGEDGLRVVRRLVAEAGRVLRPGGWLVLEIGGHQDEGLRGALDAHGFGHETTWRDDDGDLRGLAARLVAAVGR